MSEVIRTGTFERMDRFYSDVVDEVRIMAEAGDQNESPSLPPFSPAGLVSRFFARLGVPEQAH
jgi:hypothetical protein